MEFFPPLTYKVFSLLNSSQTTKFLSKKLKIPKVIPDYGLHGGGWHLMHHKGKLNPHLDYFIHPKANLQRKYNLIVFLSKGWKENWGGEICFYNKNKKSFHFININLGPLKMCLFHGLKQSFVLIF